MKHGFRNLKVVILIFKTQVALTLQKCEDEKLQDLLDDELAEIS